MAEQNDIPEYVYKHIQTIEDKLQEKIKSMKDPLEFKVTFPAVSQEELDNILKTIKESPISIRNVIIDNFRSKMNYNIMNNNESFNTISDKGKKEVLHKFEIQLEKIHHMKTNQRALRCIKEMLDSEIEQHQKQIVKANEA